MLLLWMIDGLASLMSQRLLWQEALLLHQLLLLIKSKDHVALRFSVRAIADKVAWREDSNSICTDSTC